VNIKKLGNTSLVRLCADEPSNRDAWLEFHSRFNQRISLVILRECKKRGLMSKSPESGELVQDLIQDVYLKLVEKDCKALKQFKGTSNNAIYLYLGTICRHVVINHILRATAQKRPQIQTSIDTPLPGTHSDSAFTLKDVLELPVDNADQEDQIEHLKKKIDMILDSTVKGRNSERDKIIFKLYIYEEMTPEEISVYFTFNISSKSVSNIISMLKSDIRDNW
jgi:RNA polymerase sigma factor (sigma-70 family)